MHHCVVMPDRPKLLLQCLIIACQLWSVSEKLAAISLSLRQAALMRSSTRMSSTKQSGQHTHVEGKEHMTTSFSPVPPALFSARCATECRHHIRLRLDARNAVGAECTM